MGELAIISDEGDTKVIWDPQNDKDFRNQQGIK